MALSRQIRLTTSVGLSVPLQSRRPSQNRKLGYFFEHVKNEQLRRICHFALTTGMRRSEILGLRWRDVDLDRATVSVTQTCIVLPGSSYTLVDGAKTDSSIRCISIDQGTAEMLRNQHAYFLRLKMQYPKIEIVTLYSLLKF